MIIIIMIITITIIILIMIIIINDSYINFHLTSISECKTKWQQAKNN